MDNDVIHRKLESLRRCVERLQSKLPVTPEGLRADYDLQDVIALNLQRAVQLCVDIAAYVISRTTLPAPDTMAESFTRLLELKILPPPLAERLQKAVAFRNILVHSYTDINWDIVANLVTHHLTDFVQFGHAIVRLEDESSV